MGLFSEKTIRGDREALYAVTPVLLPQAGEGSVSSVRCSRDRLRRRRGPPHRSGRVRVLNGPVVLQLGDLVFRQAGFLQDIFRVLA